MTEREKRALENLKRAIPKMSEQEKDRLCVIGETIAMIAGNRKDEQEEVRKSPLI